MQKPKELSHGRCVPEKLKMEREEIVWLDLVTDTGKDDLADSVERIRDSIIRSFGLPPELVDPDYFLKALAETI